MGCVGSSWGKIYVIQTKGDSRESYVYLGPISSTSEDSVTGFGLLLRDLSIDEDPRV